MRRNKFLIWILACSCVGALSFAAACCGTGEGGSVSSGNGGEGEESSFEDSSFEESSFEDSSEDTSVKELEYTLSEDGTQYAVTGIGTLEEAYNIVIPSTYNDLPVTSIGNNAFNHRLDLTSIVIPDSVTYIGESAFRDSGLTNITFNGTREQWDTIIKGDYWNEGVPATKVICSDGGVYLK